MHVDEQSQKSASTRKLPTQIRALQLLMPPHWDDYELIDSGGGKKFERFGRYRLVRPESQAIWSPSLSEREWEQADAVFQRTNNDDGPGQWQQRRPLPEQWLSYYQKLKFWTRLTPFRHTGIFPEHSAHWQWMQMHLDSAGQSPHVLVLFGYTGLSTLYAAQVGARVCHVDASRPAIRWAQDNQVASGLQDRPIRWIVDDVLKFVAREIRRGVRYDMILMDPPVFGRGPKGEIWRLHEALPGLVAQCVQLLSPDPVGIVINAYATNISSLTLYNVLSEGMRAYKGVVSAGELVLLDTAASRPLPLALYARWSPT